MRVLFASASMSGGGAERVVSILANELVKRGISVGILVVRGASVYALDERVRLLPVYQEQEITTSIANKVARRFSFWTRLFSLVKAFRPDVIIPVHGGGWNAKFVLLARAMGIRVIAAEHISHTVNAKQMIRYVERRWVYRLADALTVLTRSDFAHYSDYLNHVELLPNPAGFPFHEKPDPRGLVLLAAGRLDSWHHKGFDNLLAAFAQVASAHPCWRLQIAGTGDKGRRHLESIASTLGIAAKVDFLGFRQDIDAVMRSSEVFLLSSRFEGFGMVLVEAMSQGCACVSFDCEAGPSDIIDHEVDGLLVENQNQTALANALDRVMRDASLRERLSTAAREKAMRYAPACITDRWMDLFARLGLAR